ncbi:MAG: EAL domain-containing protein [Pseudomonadales bacterium]|nr:EAL domain-containing protein [Pseudomonadales bacterium]
MKTSYGSYTDSSPGVDNTAAPRRWLQLAQAWFLQMAACRLCRNLTLAAFIAVLIIESIILIPSYRNYEENLLRNREQVLRQSIDIFLLSSTDRPDPELLLTLLAEDGLTGVNLIAPNQTLSAGEPVTLPGDASGALRQLERPSLNRIDLFWPENSLHRNYRVEVRLDISTVQAELAAFVFRILGLSVLIAAFVTLVTMAVMDRMVISPLLCLRNRITAAGADAKNPLNYIEPTARNDELGEVQTALNQMLEQNGTYLQQLQALNNELDQVLSDRTRSLHATEQELRIRNWYDQLTGLANRSLFEKSIDRVLSDPAQAHQTGFVLMLGLDGFQAINGIAGHETGDLILQEIGRRLSRFTRDKRHVARLGGDIFAIVLTRDESHKYFSLEMEIQNLIESCTAPIPVGDNNFQCDVSAGVAFFPSDGDNAAILLQHAEIAMLRAKKSEDNAIEFFTADFGEQIQYRQEMLKDLKNAISNGELQLHYQPQFDSHRICVGYEALLRWQHPERGMVSPAEFIILAEESGLIIAIGNWVIDEACRTMKTWLDKGFQGRMAINLSALQFRDKALVSYIAEKLKAYQLPARHIELEITESALIQDIDQALSVLNEFAQLGIDIAIDDFGTGYSSLAYLKKFPMRRIKIDQAFVTGLPDNEADTVLCQTIVSLAHNLGCQVIAEGVETEAQALWLINVGCDELQGFLLGRPEPAPCFPGL